MIGDIELKKINLDDNIYEELCKNYIALDVETTGLNPLEDYITEVGIVVYKNRKIIKKYSSLIKIDKEIPQHIVDLTGITNEMINNAKNEKIVYEEVFEVIKEVLEEKVIMVAHNANFDMSFLQRALIRYGYIGVIRYVDTLSISRKLIKGLFNYKQDTIAKYFNIINKRAHRALSDSIVCGDILNNLLDVYNKKEQTIDITTIYDSSFDRMVKERGIIYYRFSMIKYYEKNGNTYKGLVKSINSYNVLVELNDDKIVNAECDCLDFKENKRYCKHIYALLLKTLEKSDKNE